MLKTSCIHPPLLSALSYCGHGDKILIASANYPLKSRSGDAECLYLGLSPGLPSSTDLLKSLLGIIQVERAEVMAPEGPEPEVFSEYREIFGELPLENSSRFAFYQACEEKVVRLAIMSGDLRPYSNLLLTISVIREE